MPWDPDRYSKFQQERAAPFEDLFSLIAIRSHLDVIDLGCGTGELTRRLADRLPESRVLGIDSSPEMLKRAGIQTRPGLRFEQGRIEELSGEWDLIFSHAALHWVENHAALLPRLFTHLRPGGQLAVQMPSNHTHPAHALILKVAREEPFRSMLGGWERHSPVLSIDAYAELLYSQGATESIVFEKIYPHILADANALADWNSGTALVPYFERLSEGLQERFMKRYRDLLWERWPAGPLFYAFRRTLFSAVKPGL